MSFLYRMNYMIKNTKAAKAAKKQNLTAQAEPKIANLNSKNKPNSRIEKGEDLAPKSSIINRTIDIKPEDIKPEEPELTHEKLRELIHQLIMLMPCKHLLLKSFLLINYNLENNDKMEFNGKEYLIPRNSDETQMRRLFTMGAIYEKGPKLKAVTKAKWELVRQIIELEQKCGYKIYMGIAIDKYGASVVNDFIEKNPIAAEWLQKNDKLANSVFSNSTITLFNTVKKLGEVVCRKCSADTEFTKKSNKLIKTLGFKSFETFALNNLSSISKCFTYAYASNMNAYMLLEEVTTTTITSINELRDNKLYTSDLPVVIEFLRPLKTLEVLMYIQIIKELYKHFESTKLALIHDNKEKYDFLRTLKKEFFPDKKQDRLIKEINLLIKGLRKICNESTLPLYKDPSNTKPRKKAGNKSQDHLPVHLKKALKKSNRKKNNNRNQRKKNQKRKAFKVNNKKKKKTTDRKRVNQKNTSTQNIRKRDVKVINPNVKPKEAVKKESVLERLTKLAAQRIIEKALAQQKREERRQMLKEKKAAKIKKEAEKSRLKLQKKIIEFSAKEKVKEPTTNTAKKIHILPTRKDVDTLVEKLNNKNKGLFNYIFNIGETSNNLKATDKDVTTIIEAIASILSELGYEQAAKDFANTTKKHIHQNHGTGEKRKLPKNYLEILRTSFITFGIFPSSEKWEPKSKLDLEAMNNYSNRIEDYKKLEEKNNSENSNN